MTIQITTIMMGALVTIKMVWGLIPGVSIHAQADIKGCVVASFESMAVHI